MDALVGAAWLLTGTGPGACSRPEDLPPITDPAWIPATVPGTVAQAVRAAHGSAALTDLDVDGRDWWFRTTVDADGAYVLQTDGLATIADVWVDGQAVLHSENMFRAHRVVLDRPLVGPTDLVLRIAAALPAVRNRRPRPRWKSVLVAEQGWRWLRTSLIGRVPAWSGPPPAAGPWRPLRLVPAAEAVLEQRIAAGLDGEDGIVDVTLRTAWRPGSAVVTVGDVEQPATIDADGRVRASVRVPAAERWWPHTHGAQPRYPVEVRVDDQLVARTSVGFREIAADRQDGAFTLRVNGVDVFARGAVWIPLDPLSLQHDPDGVRAAVDRVRDAGHNLIRVTGTSVYEDDDFYAACDELGVLVWQDCMLAAFDPPTAPEFTAELVAEVEQLADRLAGRACVAVLCGGAETEQQPAMLGLSGDAAAVPAVTETIPGVLAERLPDVPYVTSSPSGGTLPMHPGTGISQYFGVGAYLRPPADVRTAGVRFAGECLAISLPPEPAEVRAEYGSPRVAGHHPAWKAGVPRDRTASWDFEDIRDHYVRTLFDIDPLTVRYEDPERYLDLGRAAASIAMVETMTWWRRPRSGCGGAIVLSGRDFVPGAGWGLTTSAGRPKAPWFALRPVLAPLAVLISDDGADGIVLTLVNDTGLPVAGRLEVRTWSVRGHALDEAASAVKLPAHGATEVGFDSLLGRFTDAGHYYRFGPRERDVMQARLVADDGTLLAEQTALLGQHLRPARPTALTAHLHATPDAGRWELEVRASALAQFVAVDSGTHEPADSWFHLPPGVSRRIPLRALGRDAPRPDVHVRALNVDEFPVPVSPS